MPVESASKSKHETRDLFLVLALKDDANKDYAYEYK
jgi:hypothetical protein